MRGVTLIELLVVLVILSVLAGVTATTVRSPGPPAVDPLQARIARARSAAILSGRSIILRSADGIPALVLPDGRVLAAGFDPLTGEVHRDSP